MTKDFTEVHYRGEVEFVVYVNGFRVVGGENFEAGGEIAFLDEAPEGH